ncbi:MAG: SpoIIIAC/SpoIIIAD family protein [Clostridia bacterium]|nr:SpoIIIAC/SpoIIIAD family protein [Clostridia bacterium]
MEAVRVPIWLTACAMVIMLLRQHRPEIATLAALAAGVVSFFMLRDDLITVADWIGRAGSAIEALDGSVSVMLRAGGIALISEFASDLCSDAGEKALAGRIELAERIALTGMCVPFAAQLLNDMALLIT